MLKLRSVNSIVIAPARTGNDNNSRNTVTKIDHTNKLTRSIVSPEARILYTVVIKLIAPKIEDTPAKCKEKIAKSTEAPLCPKQELKGGYTVHPVPAPPSTILEQINKVNEGGKSQNLILFIRGNLISGAPISIGTIQFPNPPIIIGITIKKIMTKACAVTTTLKK